MKKIAVALFCVLLPCTVMGASPFKPYGLTDAEIGTVRGEKWASWRFEGITQLTPIAYNVYGYVLDNSNEFHDIGDWGAQSFGVKVIGMQSAPAVTAGDTVTFTYITAADGGELTLKVFFPAVTADTTFWIDTVGQTYSDAALTTKVGSTPTVTPCTPTPSTTPTPSVTPTLTPAATATPTPVSGDIWYQVGDSIYPVTAGTDLDLSGDFSVQSDSVLTGDVTASSLTASKPVVTDASKKLTSGAGYWTTFTSDAGSATADSVADTFDIEGGGIVTTAVTGDKVTITGTEAQNLWSTVTSNAGSCTANSLTDELSIVGGGIATTAISGDVVTVTATEADTLDTVADRGANTDKMLQAWGGLNYAGLSTNTSSALVLDFTPDWTALSTGVVVMFVAHTDCASGATLQIDSLTAKNIYEASDVSAVESGDIVEGQAVIVIYDGTQFQQISQSGN